MSGAVEATAGDLIVLIDDAAKAVFCPYGSLNFFSRAG
jgi:hypothetical protein